MPGEANEQGTVRYFRCASCGTMNPGNTEKCARCGAPMGAKPSTPARPTTTAPRLVCPKCRQPLPAGSKFCGYCGSPLPAAAKTAGPHAAPTAAELRAPSVATGPPGAGPAAFAKPQPAATPASGDATQVFRGLRVPQIEASLVEIKPDGTAGRTVRLGKETIIGRLNCDISYPNDMLLSPRHSALGVREGKLYLRDLNSQNGAYIKQRQDAELSPGDVFLIGREIFRITAANPRESPEGRDRQAPAGAPQLDRPLATKLERILLSGEVVEEYNLDKPQITLGRTTGDLIFRNDPYMSGTHARILVEPRRLVLQDLKSRNGVYRRIRNEVELRDGDEFFLGEQIFRVRIETLEN